MPGGGMSGITVADDVFAAFQELKQDRKYSYIIFKIVRQKQITVAELGDKTKTWDDLVAKLSPTDGAYIIYDLSYEGKSGANIDKPILITWNPDTANVKEKMLYSASKDALKKKLGDGFGVEVQANDFGDLVLSEIQGKQIK